MVDDSQLPISRRTIGNTVTIELAAKSLYGTHSALAYLGFLAGFETISDTVADADFRKFTELLWREEIAPSVIAPSGLSLSTYAADLMTRCSNPSIRHLTKQIAMDGS